MEAEAPGRPAQRAKRAPDNGGLREERRVCGSTDRVSHLGAVAPSWTGSVVGSEVGPDVVCDRDAVARGGNGFLGLGRGRAPTCTAVRVVKMDGWAGGGRGLDHSARGRAKGASGVQSVCPHRLRRESGETWCMVVLERPNRLLARAAYFISKPPTVALLQRVRSDRSRRGRADDAPETRTCKRHGGARVRLRLGDRLRGPARPRRLRHRRRRRAHLHGAIGSARGRPRRGLDALHALLPRADKHRARPQAGGPWGGKDTPHPQGEAAATGSHPPRRRRRLQPDRGGQREPSGGARGARRRGARRHAREEGAAGWLDPPHARGALGEALRRGGPPRPRSGRHDKRS